MQLSESLDATRTGSVGSAYFMLFVTALCWGLNAILGQLAVGEVSPMAVVTLRWLGITLLLLTFMVPSLRREWPVLRQHLKFLFLLAVLGFTGFNSLFYVASHTTTGLNVGIIQGAMPTFVFIIAFLVHGTRVTLFQVVGALITMIGVLMVAAGGDIDRLLALAFARGDVLMVVAGIFYSAYAVGLRSKPDVSPMAMFAVLAASAFIASLPLLVYEMVSGSFQAPTPKGWAVVAVITLLPSFLAQVFFIKSVAIIGPSRAGIFFNLTPVIAAIMAVAFLGEKFAMYHAVALVLVLGGIALAERSR